MAAGMAIPGNDVSTSLVHDSGGGLEGDDRFVVKRFRALACGDIRPVLPGRRRMPKAKYTMPSHGRFLSVQELAR